MHHAQSGPFRAQGGVYSVDPFDPPPVPMGAVGKAIVDDTGRVIAYCWVVPEHAGPDLLEASWNWYDRHGISDPGPSIRLVK